MLIGCDILKRAARAVMGDKELAMTLEVTTKDGMPFVSRAKRTVVGEHSSVDTPSEPATLHTHSVWNYRDQICFVGWPSGEDMRWILGEARSGHFAVHVCTAVEGSYVITANHALASIEFEFPLVAEIIYRVFSSTHGRRCGNGAHASVFPDAGYFQALVRSLGARTPPCVHFAGKKRGCTWTPENTRAWMQFADDLERVSGTRMPFESAFVPHVLVGRDGVRHTHTEFWSPGNAEAHIRRIVEPSAPDAYVEVVASDAPVLLHRCLYRPQENKKTARTARTRK
jgi:hypothetical protein